MGSNCCSEPTAPTRIILGKEHFKVPEPDPIVEHLPVITSTHRLAGSEVNSWSKGTTDVAGGGNEGNDLDKKTHPEELHPEDLPTGSWEPKGKLVGSFLGGTSVWKDRATSDLAIWGDAATRIEWRAFEVRWTRELLAGEDMLERQKESQNSHAEISAAASVERTEERALSLSQLWNLCRLFTARCTAEDWRDPLPTIADRANARCRKVLKPQDVNFYHLHYFIVLPTSVLEGVWITSAGSGTPFNKGIKVTQPNNPFPHLGTAEGIVIDVETCPDKTKALVKVTKGCFTHMVQKNLTAECGDNVVVIEGIEYARPDYVDLCENSSYMEQTSEKSQPANWFCSHGWGEAVLNFVQCCQAHADLRCCGMDTTTYWISAFAARQREICLGVDANFDAAASYKVLQTAKGILMILGEVAAPFSRIWCCYDAHCAIVGNGIGKVFDAITMHECRASLRSMQQNSCNGD